MVYVLQLPETVTVFISRCEEETNSSQLGLLESVTLKCCATKQVLRTSYALLPSNIINGIQERKKIQADYSSRTCSLLTPERNKVHVPMDNDRRSIHLKPLQCTK
jgi:hypothetical protein